MEDFQDVKELVRKVVDELQLDIVELKISEKQDVTNIEIAADTLSGGITVDQCVAINRMICERLDEVGILGEDYQVQVSSPGLDRTLVTSKDFARVIGRKVRFHLNELLAGKKEHHGYVKSVDEKNVLITVKDEELIIPLQMINKAIQIIETK